MTVTVDDAIHKLKVNLTDTCLAECHCKEGEYSACEFCDDREAVRMAVSALKKQDEFVDILLKLFGGEPPCNFNGMDEKCDEWCDRHCDEENYRDCWHHAISRGWITGDSK